MAFLKIYQCFKNVIYYNDNSIGTVGSNTFNSMTNGCIYRKKRVLLLVSYFMVLIKFVFFCSLRVLAARVTWEMNGETVEKAVNGARDVGMVFSKLPVGARERGGNYPLGDKWARLQFRRFRSTQTRIRSERELEKFWRLLTDLVVLHVNSIVRAVAAKSKRTETN